MIQAQEEIWICLSIPSNLPMWYKRVSDPNNLIEVSWWDIDYNDPSKGKYAAQLKSTGNGVGTAYLTVSFKDAPNVVSQVKVEVVSG